MLRAGFVFLLFFMSVLPWIGIAGFAFSDHFEDDLASVLAAMKSPKGFAFVSHGQGSLPADTPQEKSSGESPVTVRLIPVTHQTSWIQLARNADLPLSLRSRLAHHPHGFTDLPPGSRVFLKHILGANQGPRVVSAVLPDFRVDSWKEGAPGEWRNFQAPTVERRRVGFAGTISTNLWDSALAEGMDPELLHHLSKAFASQIDFNRDVEEGDQWRLLAQGLYLEGTLIGWDSLLAAQYRSGGSLKTAIHFASPSVKPSYFALDGEDLNSRYLASPLRFSRISSGFIAARFHPITRTVRPHLGIDFSAPTGTPVMAIGDGIISFAGSNSLSGRMIKLSHGPTRESRYLHLSHFAAKMQPGVRVEVGQIIGYVGATGLATGPHLHFEFWLDGKVIDPRGQNLALARWLPAGVQAEYSRWARTRLTHLPNWKKRGDNPEKLTQGRPPVITLAAAASSKPAFSH